MNRPSLNKGGVKQTKMSAIATGGVMDVLKVTSSAFTEGSMIPEKYTCDGDDLSPPIYWSGIPAITRSIALICDDPDASSKPWVHWVIFNIPATAKSLPEGVPTLKMLTNGSVQGTNDFRQVGYGGPCPPNGTHRYVFQVYALDIILSLDSTATKDKVLRMMSGHVLAEGQIMGKFKR